MLKKQLGGTLLGGTLFAVVAATVVVSRAGPSTTLQNSPLSVTASIIASAGLAGSTNLVGSNFMLSAVRPINAGATGKSITSPRTTLRPVILARPRGLTVSAGAMVSLSVALDSALPKVTSGKLELWLKADAGVVTDSFGRLRRWQDQSENRNDAAQPSASMQPLLVFPPALAGRPSVRFDGQIVAPQPRGGGHHICIGTYLQGQGQVDIPAAMTSFCVHRLATPSTREEFLWMVGETNPRFYGECRGDLITRDLMHFTMWAYDFDAPFPVPAGSYRIRTDRLAAGLDSVEMLDTSAAGAVNFTLPISGARPPHAGYFVGGLDPNETYSRNLNGDIAELIIYQGALDDADLRAVTDYLLDKYFPAARLQGAAFQWLFDGANIPGATHTTLVLTNAQPDTSGNYSVMVSNAAGVFISSNAGLSVTTAASSRSP